MNENNKQPEDITQQGAGGNGTGESAGGLTLHDRVVEALKTVYDPEIPVDIYELGLIYELDIDAAGAAKVIMTLTSPACPVAGTLPGEVERKVRSVDGISDVSLELVWDPPWTPERMSEAARLELNL